MRFHLIDRLVEFRRGQRASAIKAVSGSEDFFADHFPGNPIFPGVLVLESMAQTAGVLIALSADLEQFGLMTAISDVQFRSFVKPGDLLRCEVEIRNGDATTTQIVARALVGEREVARARFLFVILPLEQIIGAAYLEGWRATVRGWAVGIATEPVP